MPPKKGKREKKRRKDSPCFLTFVPSSRERKFKGA
jgi:hypothetical protein